METLLDRDRISCILPKHSQIDQMDIRSHNRSAWNQLVKSGNRWTRPISSEQVDAARSGKWEVVLTPTKPVPHSWFPRLDNTEVLCLASAGGQQAPLLAATGANVTVFDNSPEQLNQDRQVAHRDGLQLKTIEGDMADLGCFPDQSFDLVFHPCSNVFVPNVSPVWAECSRVIRPGGVLLTGFVNGVRFLFDDERKENGSLEVRYSLPYSDLEYLDQPHIRAMIDSGAPLEFGHTLDDQIGGQLRAGFVMTGFYEDRYGDDINDPISKFMSTFIATRAVKQQS